VPTDKRGSRRPARSVADGYPATQLCTSLASHVLPCTINFAACLTAAELSSKSFDLSEIGVCAGDVARPCKHCPTPSVRFSLWRRRNSSRSPSISRRCRRRLWQLVAFPARPQRGTRSPRRAPPGEVANRLQSRGPMLNELFLDVASRAAESLSGCSRPPRSGAGLSERHIRSNLGHVRRGKNFQRCPIVVRLQFQAIDQAGERGLTRNRKGQTEHLPGVVAQHQAVEKEVETWRTYLVVQQKRALRGSSPGSKLLLQNPLGRMGPLIGVLLRSPFAKQTRFLPQSPEMAYFLRALASYTRRRRVDTGVGRGFGARTRKRCANT
jgi:hypothetical protein